MNQHTCTMYVKYITLSIFLSGCSLATFQSSNDTKAGKNNVKDPPTVETRHINANKNNNKNNNPTTSAVAVPKDETVVTTVPVEKRINPNLMFEDVDYLILFDLDEYTVKKVYYERLKKHAEFLAKNPQEFLFIAGHTDERGGTEYNLALGQRRANAVRQVLIKYGAREDQVEAFSYGKEKPLADGHDEEAWGINRRAELEYRN